MQKKEEFIDGLGVSLAKGLKIPNNFMIILYPRMGSVLIKGNNIWLNYDGARGEW